MSTIKEIQRNYYNYLRLSYGEPRKDGRDYQFLYNKFNRYGEIFYRYIGLSDLKSEFPERMFKNNEPEEPQLYKASKFSIYLYESVDGDTDYCKPSVPYIVAQAKGSQGIELYQSRIDKTWPTYQVPRQKDTIKGYIDRYSWFNIESFNESEVPYSLNTIITILNIGYDEQPEVSEY